MKMHPLSLLLPKKKYIHTAITCSLILCSFSKAKADVLTSIKPLAFIASAITQHVTETSVLLPDGASPHNYALRPSEMVKLANSELFLWIGEDMETFLKKPVSQLPAKKVITISEMSSVHPFLLKEKNEIHDESHDESHHRHHHHGDINMHLWLSPQIALELAKQLHDQLRTLYPQKEAVLAKNLARFRANLEKTDKKIGKMLAPLSKKGYFVFHDGYGYFEQHYGLSPLGHFTVNPEIQPGAKRLHQIRTALAAQHAVCVFAEPQFKPAVITAVTKNMTVHSGTLDPLGIGIEPTQESYVQFLTHLAAQYSECLSKEL